MMLGGNNRRRQTGNETDRHEKAEYNPGQDNSIPATTGMTYGYIRVSTREQNEARQIDAILRHPDKPCVHGQAIRERLPASGLSEVAHPSPSHRRARCEVN